MKTDRLHGDLIAGISAYHELDHQPVPADTEVPGSWPAHELAAWTAGDDHELTGDQANRLLSVVLRPDADVQRDVLRALYLESLVPLTVDARVEAARAVQQSAARAHASQAEALPEVLAAWRASAVASTFAGCSPVAAPRG